MSKNVRREGESGRKKNWAYSVCKYLEREGMEEEEGSGKEKGGIEERRSEG